MQRPLKADLFSGLGLYVERGFLETETCLAVAAEVRAAAATPATVAEGAAGDVVDREHRRSKLAQVSPELKSSIRDRLLTRKQDLEHHLRRQLTRLQDPQFLVYREGDFFRPHADMSPDPAEPEYVRERVVSAVVFVNEPDLTDAAGYGGGALVFFGLMGGDKDADVGLPLSPESGMLVGFPSELVHGVRPVTRGERYSIATWFS